MRFSRLVASAGAALLTVAARIVAVHVGAVVTRRTTSSRISIFGLSACMQMVPAFPMFGTLNFSTSRNSGLIALTL